MSTTTPHHAPPAVQTHAQHALERYPDFRVPGLENACQVFALVAESLGQKPSVISTEGSKNGKADHRAGTQAAVQSAVGATYQPQGIPGEEKSVQRGGGKEDTYKVDFKATEKRRREWVRRLGVVFDFEVTPTSSSTADSPTSSPPHFYIDLFSTGRITLNPPPALSKHSSDASTPNTWSRRHLITIKISDRDLLAVSIGERVPVKLFSEGRLRVKGDIHKALLLGKLLSVTRSQIYASADADSPAHDLYSIHPFKQPESRQDSKARVPSGSSSGSSSGHAEAGAGRGDLEGAGMQGQGAPAGGAEWGVGGMGQGVVARAKL